MLVIHVHGRGVLDDDVSQLKHTRPGHGVWHGMAAPFYTST
jgi:hypothetical protein